MIPFNLKAAIAGEPICTRDGREAKFITYLPENYEPYNDIIVTVESKVLGFAANGKFKPIQSSLDLFMVEAKPKKAVVYMNVYPDDLFVFMAGNIRLTLEDAMNGNEGSICINEITIHEDGSLTSKIIHRY